MAGQVAAAADILWLNSAGPGWTVGEIVTNDLPEGRVYSYTAVHVDGTTINVTVTGTDGIDTEDTSDQSSGSPV